MAPLSRVKESLKSLCVENLPGLVIIGILFAPPPDSGISQPGRRLEIHLNTTNIIDDFKNISEDYLFQELRSLPRCTLTHLHTDRIPFPAMGLLSGLW